MPTFLELHHGDLFVIPNAWDAGSARVLEHLGFAAVATTSSGFAATLGRLDGQATLDEVLAHTTALCAAVAVPVSADFENGYADDAEGVAANVRRAMDTGLAGCSIEDWSGERIYELSEAVERVAAAVEAAGADGVVTARAENHLHGVDDLDDTIARLRAFADVGAQCVYAPGPSDAASIGAIVAAVAPTPVNVLARPGAPTVAELAALGVKRVSVGGALAWVAFDALVAAATELRDDGTYGFLDRSAAGNRVARAAFGPSVSP